MEEHVTNFSNQKRASWRSMCRKRLSQHIWETLGIQVKPSEVRLRGGEDALKYTWKIEDPSLEPLFDKHMSKHSVGAYMQLYREVGHSFYAVHSDGQTKQRTQPLVVPSELDRLQEDNSRLEEEVKQLRKANEALVSAKCEAEDEVQTQKSIIREAQMTIHLHQQDIQSWMAVAECYQMSCIRCSDALGQIIAFAQGVQSEIPTLPTGS
ncbi:hypothetical protein BDV59DRAFT_196628 [Aspergillus ambiguus]|uniref:uncharacterized protein n=1 Tax=Aspergillus ambiguus TaxID=176160 RepID=UPI003CCDFD36